MSLISGSRERKCRGRSTEQEIIIVPRTVDIGGFKVHRALPSERTRMVGPFIFWDQMGPGQFNEGHGVDVRPHPHIGLSTVTYLFEGSLDHRDSLGNDARIVPGDVNLMIAGRGIVHSERTGQDVRRKPSRLSGIQSWLAQPRALETSDPAFTRVEAIDVPVFESDTWSGRLILGNYDGLCSPIESQWETLYLEIKMNKGSRFKVLKVIEERALYLVSGKIEIGGTIYASRQMIVLQPGREIIVKASEDLHFLLLGGATMDGPRYIWWNFVSSSLERIRSSAEDWKNNYFETIPGDGKEFIPLPDLPFPRE